LLRINYELRLTAWSFLICCSLDYSSIFFHLLRRSVGEMMFFDIHTTTAGCFGGLLIKSKLVIILMNKLRVSLYQPQIIDTTQISSLKCLSSKSAILHIPMKNGILIRPEAENISTAYIYARGFTLTLLMRQEY